MLLVITITRIAVSAKVQSTAVAMLIEQFGVPGEPMVVEGELGDVLGPGELGEVLGPGVVDDWLSSVRNVHICHRSLNDHTDNLN